MMMELASPVTLRDVAALAQVSVGTASKAINGIYVKPELRVRVEAAVRQLGYRPNTIARSLKMKTTDTIGVIVSDISSPIAALILAGIEQRAREKNYSVMIYDTKMSSSDELQALHLFSQKMVAGIIYTSNTLCEDMTKQLTQMGIPIVLVATESEDGSLSSVTIDNEKAAYEAVSYLYSRGHREIAMIAGPRNDPNAGLPRIKGYERALAEFGIPCRPESIRTGNYRMKDGYEQAKILFGQKQSYSAVFCASDEMAVGAMRALWEMGIAVPKDVSVMGFDGIEMAQFATPSITTVRQPLVEFGLEGANVLFDKLDQHKGYVRLCLPYELVENESVRSV